MQGKAVALVVGSLLALISALPAGAQLAGRPALWDAEALVAQAAGPTVDFTRQGTLVAQVPVERVRGLVDAKQRLEAASGVTAKLMLTDYGGRSPNALATRSRQGVLVALNLAMLELMGDDADALAAVLGHEYAHLALHHGEIRREREEAMVGLGTILGLALAGRRHARTAMGTAQFGITAISRSYSRDEERAADAHGLRYAVAAGYSAQGGVRAWERMAAKGNSFYMPFLATHPATGERLQDMRALASAMPDAPQSVRTADAQREDAVADASHAGLAAAGRAPIEPASPEYAPVEASRIETAQGELAWPPAATVEEGSLSIRAIAEAREWPPAGVWGTGN
ncbi:MAG TPA: M48 family metalloprotease [Burkholderiales bacterium]